MSVINQNLLLTPEGYQISRSVRLRSSATAYFNRTLGSASNRKTWTLSGWVKRGALGVQQGLFGSNNASTYPRTSFYFTTSNTLFLFEEDGTGANITVLETTQVFRDSSAWYHVVLSRDTTAATSSDRVKLYVNGVQVTSFSTATYPTLNFDGQVNNTSYTQKIGSTDGGNYFDGYLTDVNFIDGQALTPSSFGETDVVTGVWKPKKYTGTYGTNGFFLNFSDNSNNTAATIGKDWSGNGNNWTPNNISVTAGATYDSMLDVPTLWADGGNGRGNYAVFNPLAVTSVAATFAEGNLKVTTGGAGGNGYGTMSIPASGKWYWEVTFSSGSDPMIGISAYLSTQTYAWQNGNSVLYYNNGQKYVDGAGASYGASYTTNDVIGVAVDADTGTITFYKNNTSQGSITHAVADLFPCLADGASGTTATFYSNFGQRPFAYTPPTGFKALNTQNLPDSTIKKGNAYFDVTTYSGNSSTQSIVNSGAFQPDLVWTKPRNTANGYGLIDSVRGRAYSLQSNTTGADQTSGSTQDLTAFNSNGFAVGTSYQLDINTTGNTYVGWQWKESVSAGFDIVTWAGNSTSGTTIAHSLGVAPKIIITKSRTNASSWVVGIGGMSGFGVNDYLVLQSTGAKGSSSTFYQAYGSSTFTVGVSAADEMNKTGNNYVSYLFAEVAGYSKFGSYTGNGSADGPFVYLGFRPKFVMVKRTDSTSDWVLWDTSRSDYNAAQAPLYPNLSVAEGNSYFMDALSNGFKLRMSTITNVSSGTYIYAAFAENPFKNSLAR